MFRERTLRAENFAIDKGTCLLGKAGREAFYAEYERFAIFMRRWLRRQCAALAGTLRARGAPLLDDGDPQEMEI